LHDAAHSPPPPPAAASVDVAADRGASGRVGTDTPRAAADDAKRGADKRERLAPSPLAKRPRVVRPRGGGGPRGLGPPPAWSSLGAASRAERRDDSDGAGGGEGGGEGVGAALRRGCCGGSVGLAPCDRGTNAAAVESLLFAPRAGVVGGSAGSSEFDFI
jgi:hypothetical protein